LTAVQHIAEFVCGDRRQLYHWLRAISLNHIRNFKAKQQPALSLEDIEAANPGNSDAVDLFLAKHTSRHQRLVEDEVAIREQLRLLDQALLSLKPNERDIVIRRYLWDQKPEQLAHLYSQLKPRSISQLLFRFKYRLQNRVIGLQQN
jgi:DNA-directed RNA polymerase specialized sigma24 family protein